MKYTRTLLCVMFLLVFCLSCSPGNPDYYRKDRIKEIVELQRTQPINEYVIYRSPSYPQQMDRLIHSLDPAEALVVALPYEDAIQNHKLLTFYMTLIAHAITVTDVIILVNERELFDYKAVVSQLTYLKLDRYLYGGQKHEIRIVPARFNTKWIRDYGPIFAVNTEGQICITDAIYGDIRRQINKTQFFSISDFFKVDVLNIVGAKIPESEEEPEPAERYEDDAMSMYLANHLYQKHGYDIPIVRVPFQLQGGDIFADGLNNLFLSTETLLINGGHRLDLELILKSYYGMKTVTYLEPFPGDTVKHLDMIFKPLGLNRFLVADYPADAGDSDIYMHYLHRETKRTLDANAVKLQQTFPGRALVKIPMPPIQRLSKLDDALLTLTQTLFSARNYNLPSGLISDPEQWDIRKFVFLCDVLNRYRKLKAADETDRLLSVLGPFEGTRFSGEYEAVLNRCVEKLLQSDPQLLEWLAASYRSDLKQGRDENHSTKELLNRLSADYIREGALEDPSNYFYVYRSYLNATYINGKSGRLLLVPGYSGYRAMEEKVLAVYRELFPDTRIVFINSDEIIKQYGAIHCVTITVPDFQRKYNPS
ncbi:MAG: agmatine deiminase family protein [Desulfobacterales bacterium]|nr:agmatine deiminase family protein [Desulfobacterales bacterium]